MASYIFLFFIYLTMFGTLVDSYKLIPYTVSDNVTNLNISAISGRLDHELAIVDEAMTFVDASETCLKLGYPGLLPSLPNWSMRVYVKQYLEMNNYNGLNYTFWTGLFRPYEHVRRWYKYIHGHCTTFQQQNLFNGAVSLSDGRCVVINRDETAKHRESIAIDTCGRRHPFVCNKQNGSVKFVEYVSFSVEISPMNARLIEEHNVTESECIRVCHNNTRCLAVTFNYGEDICTNMYLKKKSSDIFKFNYTIVRMSHLNVTHYAKFGTPLTFVNSKDFPPISNDTKIFSDCGVSEIPPGYRPCNETCHRRETKEVVTKAQFEQIVNKNIKDLIIDKNATSVNKRKKISAPDSRKVSKSMGIVAIVIIAGVLSLFPLCDCVIPGIRVRKTGRSRDEKKNKADTKKKVQQKNEIDTNTTRTTSV